MSHYTIANLPEKYFDQRNLPHCDPSALRGDDRLRFDRLRKGIEEYLRTKELSASSRAAGCSPPELLRQFHRFALMVGDGEILGWAGLFRYLRLKPFTIKPQETCKSPVGKFHHLLLCEPTIESGLIAAIKTRVGADGVELSRKQRREVYVAFKKLCAGIPRDEYPWDSESKAQKSVYRYVGSYLATHPEEFDIWFGHAARGRLKIGRGKPSFRLCTQPFDLVQIDAHRTDVVGTILIQTEHGPRVIPIRRIWIVLLLDTFSGAVLGYSVSFEEQISADTVERAVISSQTVWQPRELYGGLVYEPGSALPAGNVPGLKTCTIAALRMDNFSSHYSALVQTVVRKSLGCHICFGGIGTWWTNAKIERFFGILEQRGIHRVASSMGAGPADPMRPIDPVGNAINEALDWRYVVDLIEVLVTEQNALRGSGRSDMAPLEIIHNHIAAADICFLPRLPVPVHASAPRLGWEFKRKRVAGSLKMGNVRRPYIEILGRHYTNPLLSDRFDLIDTHANVHTRKADLYVEAYLPGGTPLGALKPNGGEKGHPVGMSELRMARRGRNREDWPEEQALADHKETVAKRAAADALKRPKSVSDAATELANLDMQARTRPDSAEIVSSTSDFAQRPQEVPDERRADNAPAQSVALPRFGRLRRV